MPILGIPYSGKVTVNPDCTGTGDGQSHTDSIVVVSRYEVLDMSRDINYVWTYQIRRVSGRGVRLNDPWSRPKAAATGSPSPRFHYWAR